MRTISSGRPNKDADKGKERKADGLERESGAKDEETDKD